MLRRLVLSGILLWTALLLQPVCSSYGEADPQLKRYYSVIVGTFKSFDNSVRIYEKVISSIRKDDADYLRIDRISEKFSVRLGRFEEKDTAEQLLERIRDFFPDARILLAPFDESLHVKFYGRELPPPATGVPPSAGHHPQLPAATTAAGKHSPQSTPVPWVTEKKALAQPSAASAPEERHAVMDKGLVRGVIVQIEPISSAGLGISPARTIHRVVIKVLAAEDIAGHPNILRERIGQDLTCFSDIALPGTSVGSQIRGLVEYRGDERSRLFWISGIEPPGVTVPASQ